MKEKLVSVIIPAYNAEQSLERAVRSVLSSDYQNLEVLVVDDGSTDETPAIAERLAGEDGRIRVLPEKNGGVSRARNLGLSRAAGEYITFVDADDAVSPRMIGELVRAMEETGADFAGCFFSDASHLGEGKDGIRIFEGADIVRSAVLKTDTRIWSKVFRKKALEGRTFPEDLTIGEDMLFLLRVITPKTRYAYLDRRLYEYVLNPAGAMERPFVPSYFDEIACWERAQEQIQKTFPELLSEEGTRAQLGSVQTVSVLLTAGKLAALPAGQRKKYKEQIRAMRGSVREKMQIPGIREHLPSGYPLKAALFVRCPGLYFTLMKRRKNR